MLQIQEFKIRTIVKLGAQVVILRNEAKALKLALGAVSRNLLNAQKQNEANQSVDAGEAEALRERLEEARRVLAPLLSELEPGDDDEDSPRFDIVAICRRRMDEIQQTRGMVLALEAQNETLRQNLESCSRIGGIAEVIRRKLPLFRANESIWETCSRVTLAFRDLSTENERLRMREAGHAKAMEATLARLDEISKVPFRDGVR